MKIAEHVVLLSDLTVYFLYCDKIEEKRVGRNSLEKFSGSTFRMVILEIQRTI